MPLENSPCIYPLVESIQSPYLTTNETSCGISCGDARDFYIFLSREEYNMLKTIILVASLITISLTPLYVCIAISERRRSERSCLSLPFALQCPFFISSGYILGCLIALSPFLFGPFAIICNSGENSLTINSFQNIPCSVTAIGIYISVRLAVFYTCALSVSLALTVYYPTFIQRKCCFHLIVWSLIGLGFIPLVTLKSISGNYYFGICTTSLTSRLNLLVLDIIPFVSCVCIFSVCLLLATVKLLNRNNQLVQLLDVDKDVRSLFNRLLLYNLLQTTAVVVLVGHFCYWYMNLDTWNEKVMATFKCELGKMRTNQTLPDDYEICIRERADLPRPSVWTYYIFSFCGLTSMLCAILFQCSFRVQQRSLNLLRNLPLSLWNVLTCRILYRTRARRSTFEYAFSSTEKREEITDTAIISSLDSTTSVCRFEKPPSERTVIGLGSAHNIYAV